ncbi:MAG: ABC transporter permease, partial [Prevotellaceae bacterium]|nr:ABC transporter permease [Prevotellaceae bacterium]
MMVLKFLSRNKLYTAVTIVGFSLSLAFILLLGIFIRQEFSIDKFHTNADRIFLLAQDKLTAYSANPVADLIKDNLPEVESYTRIASLDVTVDVDFNLKIKAHATFVDAAFFEIFSFKLNHGTAASVLKMRNSAVISESFARKFFPEKNLIGEVITVNDSIVLNITGIMEDFPLNTQMPDTDILINYQTLDRFWDVPESNILTAWGISNFSVYILAKQGCDLPSKSSAVLELFLKHNYWLYTSDYAKEVTFIPLKEVYFSGVQTMAGKIKTNNKTTVLIYGIIALLILIVAVLNYINLSVAQAGQRIHKTAIKKLLGSNNRDIILSFIKESILITSISLFLAFILAFLFKDIFEQILNTKLYIVKQLTDVTFLIITILGVFIVGIMTGLIPALAVFKVNLAEVLKGTYSRKVKMVYSKIFISLQYLVAFVLLACCGFIAKQTIEMQNHDLKFNYQNLYRVFGLIKPENRQGLKSALERISGIEMISFSGSPLSGYSVTAFNYDGKPLSFDCYYVDSSFFNILEIKVNPTGVAKTEHSIWVNKMGYEALQVDRISHSFSIENNIYHILGVFDNIIYKPLRYKSGMLMVFPHKPDDNIYECLIKTALPINSKTISKIKETYLQFNIADVEISSGDDHINNWYSEEKKTINIIAIFAVITFAILIMGIVAMTLYYVQQNKKNICIRKVYGANINDILIMCNRFFL